MLKERPDDTSLMRFAVEIEMAAGEHKKAVELARQSLQFAPDDVDLREQEITALAHLRRRSEAERLLKRFEQDFPLYKWKIEPLKIMMDSLYERSIKLKSRLDEYEEFANEDPANARELGLAYHAINDLFRAQRVMLGAHQSFPDDVKLNEALATNSFQLVRPATARKYASLALASAPDNGRMRLIKYVSYLLYFPPFFLIAHFMKVVVLSNTLVSWYGGIVVGIALVYFAADLERIWWDILSVALKWPLYKYSSIFVFALVVIYLLATHERLYHRFVPKKRALKVRDY